MIVASFSGGKDSTAMVLRMIELGEQLDMVIYCDTTMEFPAMYDHIAKVRSFVETHGVQFVTLKHQHDFDYFLYDKPVNSKRYGEIHGYGFPFMANRWCTKEFKTRAIDRFLKPYGKDVVRCVGLAYDEVKRRERPNNIGNRHPLAEWKWTEADCLAYCYSEGFDWYDPSIGKGLYEIFDRTSCWICPLSNLDYFRQLRRYYPDLWQSIKTREDKVREERLSRGENNINAWKFTPLRSWQDLEDRFAKEDLAARCQQTLF